MYFPITKEGEVTGYYAKTLGKISILGVLVTLETETPLVGPVLGPPVLIGLLSQRVWKML